jgi:hypothetical protein
MGLYNYLKSLNGMHIHCALVLYRKDYSMSSIVSLTLGLSSFLYLDVVELHTRVIRVMTSES